MGRHTHRQQEQEISQPDSTTEACVNCVHGTPNEMGSIKCKPQEENGNPEPMGKADRCGEFKLRGGETTQDVPVENADTTRSLKGRDLTVEMPQPESSRDLYSIPGVREAMEAVVEQLYKNLEEDSDDSRQRKVIVEFKIDPDMMKVSWAVKLETPKPKPIKIEGQPVFGIRENGTIRVVGGQQTSIFD